MMRKVCSICGAALSWLYLMYLSALALEPGSRLKMLGIACLCAGACVGVLELKRKKWPLSPLPDSLRWAAALTCIVGALFFWQLVLPHRSTLSLVRRALLCVGAGAIADFFLERCLELAQKRAGPLRTSDFLFAAAYAGVYFLLFTTTEDIMPTSATRAFLALLTVLTALICWRSRKMACMDKYRTRSARAAIGGTALYGSLASFGQRFFLNGNTRMHVSLSGVWYCVLGFLWFLPLLWSGLCLLEGASARCIPKTRSPRERSRAKWLLFSCLAVSQAVLLYAFWPGSFPEDAHNQLLAAVGAAPLNDWHPVLNTLLERGILTIFPNAGMIVAVQMGCFLLLLTAFLMIGYDRGMPLPWLCLGGCLFVLLPNQALSWTNAMKDYSFTLALLWGTYLLLQLVLDTPWSRKWSFWPCLTLDLFLTACLRHNGMVPFLFVGILCLWLTLRRTSQVRFRALAAFGGALLSVIIFKGPVYKALNVIPNIQSPYTTMLCAVGSYINKDMPLSETSQKIMETVIPLEDWRDYYSRFEGHDVYYWGRPAESVPYDTSEVTASMAFRVYLEALFRAPDVVIKDRLDGMDIMWDVTMPPDSFNGNGFDYTYVFDDSAPPECLCLTGWGTEDGHQYYSQNPIARWYHQTENSPINGAANILLWRTGAYLIALLLLLIFWWKNGMGRMLWAALPMLGNMAASILVLYHQSFRYVYFIQLIVLALLFVTVAVKRQFLEPEKTKT